MPPVCGSGQVRAADVGVDTVTATRPARGRAGEHRLGGRGQDATVVREPEALAALDREQVGAEAVERGPAGRLWTTPRCRARRPSRRCRWRCRAPTAPPEAASAQPDGRDPQEVARRAARCAAAAVSAARHDAGRRGAGRHAAPSRTHVTSLLDVTVAHGDLAGQAGGDVPVVGDDEDAWTRRRAARGAGR